MCIYIYIVLYIYTYIILLSDVICYIVRSPLYPSSTTTCVLSPGANISTALRKALGRLHDHRKEPPSSHGGRWCGWIVAAARCDPRPGLSTSTPTG